MSADHANAKSISPEELQNHTNDALEKMQTARKLTAADFKIDMADPITSSSLNAAADKVISADLSHKNWVKEQAAYSPDGKEKSESVQFKDGTTERIEFGATGRITSEDFKHRSGAEEYLRFNKSGKLEAINMKREDGTREHLGYGPDGQMKTASLKHKNGTEEHLVFGHDGKLKDLGFKTKHEKLHSSSFAGGQVIDIETLNGAKVQIESGSDGQVKSADFKSVDGEIQHAVYDASGKIVSIEARKESS